MRKILTLAIMSAFCSQIFAQQIYNGTFGTWYNGTPHGWSTTHTSFSNTTHETQDAAASFEGSSSVKLVGGILPPPANFSYPGMLHYGSSSFDANGQDFFLYGVSFGYRPDSLQFAYKYSPSFQDSANVLCSFYTGNIGNIVGLVDMVLYASSSYKLVTVPIKYLSTRTPDSLSLTFYSGNLSMPHANSNLHVAGVKFIYKNGTPPTNYVHPTVDTATHAVAVDTTHHTTTGINDATTENDIKVFPNPASTKINFSLTDNLMGGIIRVYNILGSELITSEIGNNIESIDICPLENGVYIYRILDKNNKLITTSKFIKE